MVAISCYFIGKTQRVGFFVVVVWGVVNIIS